VIFFGSLFRWLKPIVFSDATRGALRTIGKEALRTGGRVLADMADNTDVSTRDIVSKQLGVAAKNLVTKMRGSGTRKRKRAASATSRKRRRIAPKQRTKRRTRAVRKKHQRRRKPDTTKRDIFSE